MKKIKKYVIETLIIAVILWCGALFTVLLEGSLPEWPVFITRSTQSLLVSLVGGAVIAGMFFLFEYGQDAIPESKEGKFVFKYGFFIKISGIALSTLFLFFLWLGLTDHITIIATSENWELLTRLIVFAIILWMICIGLSPFFYELVLDDDRIWQRKYFRSWQSRSLKELKEYSQFNAGYSYHLDFEVAKTMEIPFYLKGETELLKLLDAQIEKNKNA